jgi:hypothetical protein
MYSYFAFYWVRIAQSLFVVDACVEHYSNTTGIPSGVVPVSYISSIILNLYLFAYDFVDY